MFRSRYSVVKGDILSYLEPLTSSGRSSSVVGNGALARFHTYLPLFLDRRVAIFLASFLDGRITCSFEIVSDQFTGVTGQP